MTDIVERLRDWPAVSGKGDALSSGFVGAFMCEAADTIATLRADVAALREGLAVITNHYIRLVDSGDAGHWNPRDEPEVQQARALLETKESGL